MTRQFFILLALALLAGCSVETVAVHSEGISGNLKMVTGTQQSWEELPIPFYISTTVPEEFVTPILDSFSIWEEKAGISLFDYRGRIDSSSQTFDGRNVVYWDTESHPNGYLGETHLMTINETTLIETDIVFHGDFEVCEALTCETKEENCRSEKEKYDLTTTALHEIGHVLGFEHVSGADLIMNPRFTMKDVYHRFDETLLSGLHNLYNPTTLASQ